MLEKKPPPHPDIKYHSLAPDRLRHLLWSRACGLQVALSMVSHQLATMCWAEQGQLLLLTQTPQALLFQVHWVNDLNVSTTGIHVRGQRGVDYPHT